MNVIVIINIMKYSLNKLKGLSFNSALFDVMTRLQADYRGSGEGVSILGKDIKDPLACLAQTVSGTEHRPFHWVPRSTSLENK
jgi:hypothetical protein